jgi:hypothetical protein
MAVTTGMMGHGFYDRNSSPRWAGIEAVLPWLDEALAQTEPRAAPPPVGDFGCSEGANSMRVVQRLIAALRTRTDCPIQAIHSGLPTDDYGGPLRGLRQDGRSACRNCSISTCSSAGQEAYKPIECRRLDIEAFWCERT